MKKSSRKGLKISLIIIIIILVICLGVLILGFYKYQDNLKEKDKEYQNLEEILDKITLKEEKVEYGTTWSYQELLNNLNITNDKNSKVSIAINDLNIEKIEYQFKKLGDSKINITLSKDYEYKLLKTYKETLMVNKELKIKVEDTKMPVINGIKDKEIMVSDKIDLKEGIEAMDDIDGKLDFKIEGNVDTNKAGTYEIKVIAEDLNGNKTEEKFKVVVKEKPKETPKPSTSNNNTSSNKNNSTNNNTSTPKTDKSTKEGRLYLAKEEAKKVVKNIIKPGMSDYEKAFQIFSYLHNKKTNKRLTKRHKFAIINYSVMTKKCIREV